MVRVPVIQSHGDRAIGAEHMGSGSACVPGGPEQLNDRRSVMLSLASAVSILTSCKPHVISLQAFRHTCTYHSR